MSEAAPPSPGPAAGWQPLTFGGVASFAIARAGRVWLVQLIMAAVISVSIVWFVHRAYFPVLWQAIGKLPETAGIYDGRLHGLSDNQESGSKFLVLAATPLPAHEIGQGADLQIQLRQSDFCAVSLFRPDWGLAFPYGATVLSLSPSNLGPWLGAWTPMLLAGLGAAVMALLLASWIALATCYCGPAKLIALLADRELGWGGAWKLCAAALMPGAVMMLMAILLYAWQGIDLTGLAFFEIAHLITGWIYFPFAVLKLPRVTPKSPPGNPFTVPSIG